MLLTMLKIKKQQRVLKQTEEVLWRLKTDKFTIPQEVKENKRTWTQASWIQVRGGLLGQDFWSTDQRSQPVLWPSQSTDSQKVKVLIMFKVKVLIRR